MFIELYSLIAPFYIACVAGSFGLIIGSFLNVVVYRLHTGRSLSGRSHCLTCAAPLLWYELLPVVSYLALRGRCGHCGAWFTPRYALVEALTAGLFFMTWLLTPDVVVAFVLSGVMATFVVIVVYDMRHYIIPDECVAALIVLALMLVGYHVWQGTEALAAVSLRVAAAFAGAGFFYFLWRISEGRWLGFGDVKLAVPLGLLVGPTQVFSFIVLSFWIGAAISLALVAAATLLARGQRGLRFGGVPRTMKSAVPFAPFLVAAAIICLWWPIDVVALFSYDFIL